MGREDELMKAAQQGNIPTLERLLSKSQTPLLRRGPNVNTQDSVGYTALHHTALHGHYEACQILLNLGSNANARDSKGCCPLHLAAWSGHAKVAQLLVTGRTSQSRASINAQDMAGDTALHMAAQHGNSESLTPLLKFGADALRTNEAGRSALDLAALYGRTQAVQLLLEHSPKLLSLATDKHTPLHLAARNGHHEIVSLLIKHGMDVNATCSTGTALHEAALYGRTEVVRILIDAGIDTSIPNAHGKTAMDVLDALPKGKTKHVRALLNRVADTEDESIPKARVVMDYVPSVYDEDALPLKQGDMVVVLDNNTKGWWKGQVGTRVGVFPHTYVEMVPSTDLDSGSQGPSPNTRRRQFQPQQQQQQQQQQQPVDDEDDDTDDGVQQTEPSPQSPHNCAKLVRTETNPFLDEAHADIDADIARAAANVFFNGPTAGTGELQGEDGDAGADADEGKTVLEEEDEFSDELRVAGDAGAGTEYSGLETAGDADSQQQQEDEEQEMEQEMELEEEEEKEKQEEEERVGEEEVEKGTGGGPAAHEDTEAGDDTAEQASDGESGEETEAATGQRNDAELEAREGREEGQHVKAEGGEQSAEMPLAPAEAGDEDTQQHDAEADSGEGEREEQEAKGRGKVEEAATPEAASEGESAEAEQEPQPEPQDHEQEQEAPVSAEEQEAPVSAEEQDEPQQGGDGRSTRVQQGHPTGGSAHVPEPGGTSSFAAQYMGTKTCSRATEGGAARALGKMRKSGKFLQDKPPIRLDVTWDGVSFVDAGTGMVIVSHARSDLVCATVDPADACMFAYVTTTETEGAKTKRYCHAFKLSHAGDAATCAQTVRAVVPQAEAAAK